MRAFMCCDYKQRLADFLRPGGVLCITGAGISTESGIPDYRGPNGSYSKVVLHVYMHQQHQFLAPCMSPKEKAASSAILQLSEIDRGRNECYQS